MTLRPVSLSLAGLGLAGLGLALLVALASALYSTGIPVYAGLLLAVLWLLAVIRPHAALLVLAVTVPLLRGLNSVQVDTEAIVILILSGTMIAAVRTPLTTLEPQRPAIAIPGIVLSVVAVWSSLAIYIVYVTYVPEGVALMLAVARHARDGVMRPIHLLRATAIGALIMSAITLGLPPTRAVNAAGSPLSVTDLLATAVDPRHGALGGVGLAALLWMGTAAAVRISRGLKASPNDRLLLGSAGALVAFVVACLTSHWLRPEAAFLFWILLGATLARADGDAQPPLGLPQ